MNATESCEGFVAGGVRVWLRVEGLSVVALSLLIYWHLGFRWWIFSRVAACTRPIDAWVLD